MDISNINAAAGDHVWSGASTPSSPTQKMSDLFGQIDPSGSGTISKDQFENAFKTMNPPASFQAAGADSVWEKLDPNNAGSVSKQDFVNTMTSLMKSLRGHHLQGNSATGAGTLNQNADALNALLSQGPDKNPSGDTTGTILNALV